MSKYQTVDIGRSAAMFAALSNPNRLQLFLRVVDHCGNAPVCATDEAVGACVGELAEGLGIAASTVSHHLKELRLAGLISMTRNGRSIECAVDTAAVDELSALLNRSDAALAV